MAPLSPFGEALLSLGAVSCNLTVVEEYVRCSMCVASQLAADEQNGSHHLHLASMVKERAVLPDLLSTSTTDHSACTQGNSQEGTGSSRVSSLGDSSVSGPFHNIFINNLGPNVTADTLCEVFERYGQLTSVVVMRDEHGRSRGFGFANFLEASAAAAAIEGLKGYDKHGTTWNLAPAVNKKGTQSNYLSPHYMQAGVIPEESLHRNLYIRNLCWEVDEAMLLQVFSEYGVVESCRVLRDANGNSRSVGFVQYKELDCAKRALKGMNGRQLGTKTIYVQVARHHLDDSKRAQLMESMLPVGSSTAAPAPSPFVNLPGVDFSTAPEFRQGSLGTPAGVPFFPAGAVPATPLSALASPQGSQEVPRGPGPVGTLEPMGLRQLSVPATPSTMYMWPGMQAGAVPSYYMAGSGPFMYMLPAGAPMAPWVPTGVPSAPSGQPDVAAIKAQLDKGEGNRSCVLGEALFPLVSQLTVDPAAVPKITGMLLELKDEDVFRLLEDPEYLQFKVWSAQRVMMTQLLPVPVAGGAPGQEATLAVPAPGNLATYGRASSNQQPGMQAMPSGWPYQLPAPAQGPAPCPPGTLDPTAASGLQAAAKRSIHRSLSQPMRNAMPPPPGAALQRVMGAAGLTGPLGPRLAGSPGGGSGPLPALVPHPGSPPQGSLSLAAAPCSPAAAPHGMMGGMPMANAMPSPGAVYGSMGGLQLSSCPSGPWAHVGGDAATSFRSTSIGSNSGRGGRRPFHSRTSS